jgi:hypothetical protein
MAPFKRHLGQRVAGVAVVSVLVVLGLDAPAFATPPTISSFSPSSGPTGCVVVIRGTNFDNPIVTSVDIGRTPVSAFKIVSRTQIWATIAGDASGASMSPTRAIPLGARRSSPTRTRGDALQPSLGSYLAVDRQQRS